MKNHYRGLSNSHPLQLFLKISPFFLNFHIHLGQYCLMQKKLHLQNFFFFERDLHNSVTDKICLEDLSKLTCFVLLYSTLCYLFKPPEMYSNDVKKQKQINCRNYEKFDFHGCKQESKECLTPSLEYKDCQSTLHTLLSNHEQIQLNYIICVI